MLGLLDAVAGSWGSEVGGFDGEGSQYSTIRRAAEKMRDWMIWSFIPSDKGVGERSCSSSFWKAMASSRRMAIHSVALRLLCWKRSIRGVERRREVYWRWSWDLRNSGGR